MMVSNVIATELENIIGELHWLEQTDGSCEVVS